VVLGDHQAKALPQKNSWVIWVHLTSAGFLAYGENPTASNHCCHEVRTLKITRGNTIQEYSTYSSFDSRKPKQAATRRIDADLTWSAISCYRDSLVLKQLKPFTSKLSRS